MPVIAREWRVVLAAIAAIAIQARAGAADTVINPPPQPKDWAALASLPDWSGVWTPNMTDQERRIESDPVPWNKAAAAEIAKLEAAEKRGDPKGLFVNCLPESMPSWMLLTHNALEFLFTPGRVTILGESDGNRLRRIYTDGRGHPDDPDLPLEGGRRIELGPDAGRRPRGLRQVELERRANRGHHLQRDRPVRRGGLKPGRLPVGTHG